MKFPIAILTLVLCASALSGCITDEGATKEASTSSSSGSTNSTANRAPVPVVAVLDNGTALESQNGTYEATAGVNLTFDASNSTDPEGQNLTFAWDFGSDASAEGAIVAHTFAEAGNYTVGVTATDSAGASSNQSLSFVVVPGGPAPGSVVKVEAKKFTGSVTNPTVAECGVLGEGIDMVTFEWEFTAAEPDGTATQVNHVLLKMTGDTTNVDSDLYFYDPAGKELGKSTGGTPTEKVEVSKDLAPGKYKVVVMACAAIDGGFEINGEATYVAA